MAFNLTNTSNIGDTALLELDGAFTVTTAEVGGTTFVFVAGLRDDGISVFSADQNGVLTNVFNVTDDATLELSAVLGLTTVVVAGVTYLIASGFDDNGLSVFSVGNDGTLTNVDNLSPVVTETASPGVVTTEFTIFGPSEITTAEVGGTTYLFVTEYLSSQVSVYSIAVGGTLTAVATVEDDAARELQQANSIATAEINGATYLFVGGQFDDGLSVFSVGADGSLSNLDNVADNAALELEGIRAVETAKIDGTTFVFAAGRADDGISVFSVAANGTLTNVANLRDTLATELDGASALRVMKIGSTTYLFAGGTEDDGFSVFSVGSDGSLTNLTNVTDFGPLRLDRLQSLAVAEIGERSFLFATGENDDGLSTFLINPPIELDLAASSDSGVAGDNVTNDATPTITFQVETGAILRVDWGDGAGFQPTVAGTGTLQELTRATPYETEGPRTIRLEATGSLGNVQTGELVVDIDWTAPAFDEGALVNVENVSDTSALQLSMVSGVATAVVDGETYLFAAGSSDAGVSVFRVAPDGTLSTVENIQDTGNLALGGAASISTAVVGETTFVFVAGALESGISVFAVNADGTLTATDAIFDGSGVNLAGVANIATVSTGERTYLFSAAPDDNGIGVFVVRPDGTLENVDNVSDNSTLELAGVLGLAATVVDGKVFLFAGGSDDNGISVFQVNSEGALSELSRTLDTGLLRIDGVTALATMSIAGTPYLFASGRDDGGISVFSVGADGSLTNLESVADTPSRYLGHVDSLTTAEIAGATYLFAASASENGVSAFLVSDAGRLTNVANIGDNWVRDLGGVAGLATAVMDGAGFLISAGRLDSGLSIFSVESAITLAPQSDTGLAGDNLTSDRTPTLSYQVEAGANVSIDWDDGRGYVPVADGTGAVQQITRDMAYASDGVRTIKIEALDDAGNTSIRTLRIDIDSKAPVFEGFDLTNTDNVSDNSALNLSGIRDIKTVSVDGNAFVLASGYRDDGLSVFALDGDGILTSVSNVNDNAALELLGPTSIATAVVADTTYVIAAATADDGISVFQLSDSGTLSNVDNVKDDASLELDGAYSVATATVEENTFVFVSGFNDDGLSVFQISESGKLFETDSVQDTGTLQLNGATGIATARVGEVTYLFAGGYYDDGISVFAVASDGTFNNTFNIKDTGDLNLNQVSSLATARIGERTYLFSASNFDNGISVFEVDIDGSLTNVANVNDDLTMRLAGTVSVTTVELNGATYLFAAASSDNGVSVFEVAENGTLTNVTNVADDGTLELHSARSVSTIQVDGTTFMLAAGQSDNGFSVFSVDAGIELAETSDTGMIGDNVTSDTTPTISYNVENGVLVRIDWGDGRGFVAAPDGTGTQQQITAAAPYLTSGPKTITVEAFDLAGNSSTRQLPITVQVEPQVGAPVLMAQTGELTGLTHVAQTITLDRNFENPVVFAKTVSVEGPAPVTVRIDDVQSSSFTMMLQEPNNEDGIHPETVAWIVLEAGSWELADGTTFEVGTLDSARLSSNPAGFEKVDFSRGLFDETPSIQSQIQTLSGADFVFTRQRNADAEGFELVMQEEEALNNGGHARESIGWFAMEKTRGLWDGFAFEAGSVGDRVTHDPVRQFFNSDFHKAPLLLTSLSRFDGLDPAAARAFGVTGDGFDVRAQEDTSADVETDHVSEDVDFLAIARPGDGRLQSPELSLLSAREARPVIAEYGTVSMDEVAVDVAFDNSFLNPVVFASVSSFKGPDPVTVRIGEVTATGFTARLQEPGNLDDLHAFETVSWMVVEAGVWELADGTVLQAAQFDGDILFPDGSYRPEFSRQAFDTAPTVITQVQTLNDPDFVLGRTGSVTDTGFHYFLQEEESSTARNRGTEGLGWLAVSPGTGQTADDLYEAGRTPDNVTHTGFTQNFIGTLPDPVLLTQLGFDGSDPTNARVSALTPTGFDVFAQEDTSADAEIIHTTETVDYLALSGDGVLQGKAHRPVIAEIGQISLTHVTQTVTLQHDFDDPVVFALTPTENGTDPVAVRITDVAGDAFTLRLQEPNYEDGSHWASETVSWLVVERGTWTLSDGTRLEAGTLQTNTLAPNSGFAEVSFSRDFGDTPAIFSQVQTDDGSDWVVTRQTNADSAGFDVAMQEEEANLASGHVTETLGWLAIDEATGFWDGHAYQTAATGRDFDHDFDHFDFGTHFAETPRLLASLASFHGSDPAALRYRDLDTLGVDLRVMEEQSADPETFHFASEEINLLAFEGSGLLTGTEWL